MYPFHRADRPGADPLILLGVHLSFESPPELDLMGPTMFSDRVSRDDLDRLCDTPGPDDGIDPRWLRDVPEDRHIGRKTLQLCRQVGRILQETLAGLADDVLRDLDVVGVGPASGSGRLLVTLRPAATVSVRDPAIVSHHLARAHNLLRQEVAQAVHRRKAPDLVYRVIE